MSLFDQTKQWLDKTCKIAGKAGASMSREQTAASASRRRRSLSNTPEKSALSLADILSHEVSADSIIGPNKGCGGWGYPEINRVGRRVKEGAEELIRFTNREIEKAKGG